ncbi:hypothetical protein BJF78_30100 [Pseudonocardia sp. CNS-139]|nr:hypothetical protein BJF78_30100 [Pseudonocardia sp. CNS-139]
MDDLARMTLETEGIGPAQRAARARRALEAYPGQGVTEERVGDLIADLLHALEAAGYDREDVGVVPTRGEQHWLAEREDPDADAGTVTVQIDNTYACGHSSTAQAQVAAPTPDQDLDVWWNETVQPHTGDGHACGASENALYEARVVEAPGRPELVGLSTDWEG